ncbi:hypothetical protein I4F81_002524 [Pyropia yezoensis]|uniref:Uncharacterized protein n=1 Tax=Pyropia yezoensis TaxID=2788 RepID=A0ACC3BQY0_PYRYE|nr:hypothetical protein I4F81_002524 [Neopyropia yezoensis]
MTGIRGQWASGGSGGCTLFYCPNRRLFVVCGWPRCALERSARSKRKKRANEQFLLCGRPPQQRGMGGRSPISRCSGGGSCRGRSATTAARRRRLATGRRARAKANHR